MRTETEKLTIGKMKYVVQLITGLLFLVQVVIAYLPSVLENGLYEIELTFLSNSMMGMIFIIGGLMGIIKTLAEITENEQAKKEVCNNIKNVMKDYMPADKLDKVDEIFYSVAEGYVFTRKESN